MVPVFGVTGDSDFDRYRIELGQGLSPSEWEQLLSSREPQLDDNHEALLAASPDRTVFGNLATWDTGLKSYTYGDEYPLEKELDLQGVYTIRLVVTKTDGTEVEDRVTVEVGRVISNIYGGFAESPDKKMSLTVPEHASTDGSQLVSLTQAESPPPPAAGREQAGGLAQCRESGERFTKPAQIAIELDGDELDGADRDRVGLYAYDAERETWEYLDSRRPAGTDSIVADVYELAPYYTLMASDAPTEGSRQVTEARPADPGRVFLARQDDRRYLVRDDFEEHPGGWSNRDRDAGAEVRRVRAADSGDYSLEIRNTHAGGNFAVNVWGQPYDVARYPLVSFDYRLPPGVKTNFLVKVDGRWYDILFTDDPKQYRRLNMEPIGRVAGVAADGGWHRASFDLEAMLRAHPPLDGRESFVVDEMIMADWDSAGYMKLVHGHNRQGATYFIDDFTIEARQSEAASPRIRAASFAKAAGEPKGSASTFATSRADRRTRPEAEMTVLHAVPLAARPSHAFHSPEAEITLEAGGGEPPDAGLTVSYDVSAGESYAGFYLPLDGLDASAARSLAVRLRGAAGGEIVRVGLKSSRGEETKVFAGTFLEHGVSRRFARALIPLEAFAGITDFESLENVSFSFEHRFGSEEGSLVVEEVAFVSQPAPLVLTRCGEPAGLNLWGEPAATVATSKARLVSRTDQNGCFLYFSGVESSRYEESWAVWVVPAGGLDLSRHEHLQLSVERLRGRERPNVYVDDGERRAYVNLEEYAAESGDDQIVRIPLEDFAEQGVDLRHVKGLELVFEWERMAGALYVRDVLFTPRPPPEGRSRRGVRAAR